MARPRHALAQSPAAVVRPLTCWRAVMMIVPRAEKADALCGLGAEARHVLRRADALGERAPRSVEHLVELQAQQHGERRAERREHIGRKPGGAVFALALKPDQPAAEHGEEDTQHHRDDIQFTQVGEYGRHGCAPFFVFVTGRCCAAYRCCRAPIRRLRYSTRLIG